MNTLGPDCSLLASTINPDGLDQIATEEGFDFMMNCLYEEMNRYVLSDGTPDSPFVIHHKSVVSLVVPSIQIRNFETKLERYLKRAELRLLGAEQSLLAVSAFVPRLIQNPNRLLDLSGYYVAAVGHLFFAIENSCKVVASLGDATFAAQVATELVTHHAHLFKALRRMSNLKVTHDFGALKSVYAYLMKARMLADYSELIQEHQATWHNIPELIYPSVKTFRESVRKLLFECRGI